MLVWLALIIAALTALLALAGTSGPSLDQAANWQIAAGVVAALALLYAITLRSGWSETASLKTRLAAGALAIAGAAALGFGLLPDISVLTHLKLPIHLGSDETRTTAQTGPASVRIRRNSTGAFTARGQVNGTDAELRVDTGAAAVVLRASDAEAAGINLKDLQFDTALQTANGPAYVAPARARTVQVGPIAVADVEVFVAKPGTLNENLLGMSFLRRLTSYEIAGEFLTLRQ